MRKHLFSVVALAALMLTGCSGDNNKKPTEQDPPQGDVDDDDDDDKGGGGTEVSGSLSLSIKKAKATIKVGETFQIEIRVVPETATVTYESSDATVATVSSSGLVTAVKEGSATINVKAVNGALNKTSAVAITVEKKAEEGGDDKPIDPANDPTKDKTDIFYSEGKFPNGGEAQMSTQDVYYWNGEGATVSSATATGNKYSITYTKGSLWYHVQLFYKAPYQENGNSFATKLLLKSTVAGDITVNGQVVSLKANSEKEIIAERTIDNNSVLSIQLGVDGKSVLDSGTFEMTVEKMVETTANASYHKVTFADGESTLKTIQVKDGKTVAAPTSPTAPEGKIFAGWFSGETMWTSELAITSEMAFASKYTDASTAHDVTYHLDGKTVKASVADGSAIEVPSSLEIPFAYEIAGWYTDEALTTAYDVTAKVTADLNLYAKLKVKASTHNMTATNNEDGDLISEAAVGTGNVWDKQTNLMNVPVGVAGKYYKITFDYKLNVTGGDFQIYNNNPGYTVGGKIISLQKSDSFVTGEITYEGGSFSNDNKLTFELGNVQGTDANIHFELKNIKLVEFTPTATVKATASKAELIKGKEGAKVTLASEYFSGTVTYSYAIDSAGTGKVAVTANEDGTYTVAATDAAIDGDTATVTFTGTSGDVSSSDTITFTIKEAVATVTPDKTDVTARAGDTFEVTLTFADFGASKVSDITASKLTFSDETVASLKEQGATDDTAMTAKYVFNALKAGTTTITAEFTCGAKKATATISVTVSEKEALEGTPIATADDLAKVFTGGGEACNNSYYLTADIDASSLTAANNLVAGSYVGTFNGNGHKITGLSVKNSVFNIVGTAGKIINLEIDGTYTPEADGFGFLAYQVDGTISDVTLNYEIKTARPGAIGAVAFMGSATVSNMNVTVKFGKDLKMGAFFATYPNASLGGSFSNCTMTAMNHKDTTTENKTTIAGERTGWTIDESQTWGE